MMTGVNGFSPMDYEPQMTPTKQNGKSPVNGPQIRQSSPLQTKGLDYTDGLTTSLSQESPLASPLSPAPSNPDASQLDAHLSPWSSAVGRAQTGKSGRVIEKLMAENDRLRRELKLETIRREEEQKRGENARGKMESLQATNDSLIQMRDVDKTALARRDRKLEELKSELETERVKRHEAESELRVVQRDTESSIQEMRRELKKAVETSKKATTQYEVLSSSWRHLDEGYRRKTERLKNEFASLKQERKEDSEHLERLEVTVEQQRQEFDKMRQAKDGVVKEFESYKTKSEESTSDMRERAERNEKANNKALEETQQVLGQMRHIINVKKFVKVADIDGEKP